MPCSFIDIFCDANRIDSGIRHAVGSAAGSVVGDFLDTLANGIRDAVNWLFTQSASWWVHIPSPDLVHEPAIMAMRQWLLPVTVAVAVGGIMAAGLRMVVTRRATPLLDVGGGLAAIAAAATVGVVVPNLLLQAGDVWSDWVLRTATGGQFTQRLTMLTGLSNVPVVIVIIFGILALVLGAVQGALLVFRQAAVIILAALIPLAAAGTTAPLTRTWIRKLLPWMLALTMYKPAAAAVYATAFTMMGKGADLQTVIMGFVMLVLSLLAMPVLMRFFTWTTGAVSSGGGGSGFLGMAAAGGVFAAGAVRGSSGATGGASVGEHASYLSSQQTSDARPASGAAVSGAASAQSPGGVPGGGPTDGDTAGRVPGCGREPTAPGGGGGNAAAAASSAGASGGAAAEGAAGAGAAATTAAATATAGAAGAAMAAVMAAGGLASGARNVAASATEDGERR